MRSTRLVKGGLQWLLLWSRLAVAASHTSSVLISSPNAWYSVQNDGIHLIPTCSDPVTSKVWVDGDHRQAAMLCLNDCLIANCGTMPCTTALPALWQGEHVVTAWSSSDSESGDSNSGPSEDGTCAACGRGEDRIAELRFVVEAHPPSGQSEFFSRADVLHTWQDEDGEELFRQIREQEDAEYRARHRIDPREMGQGTACAGRSVCGVWLDPLDDSQCADLCTSTTFLPTRSLRSFLALKDNSTVALEQICPLTFTSGSIHNLQTQERKEATEELRRRLFQRQFPPAQPPLLSLRSPASPTSGFGVTMVYAAHNLAKAFATNTLYAPARDTMTLWTSQRYCGEERHLGCYFEAVTNVSVQLVDADRRPLSLPSEREQDVAGIDGIMHDFGLPDFTHLGSFWLQAMALDFIWKPNRRSRAYIKHLQAQRPLRHPAIAMHVRRGDSHLAGRWMPTLDTYLQAAETMRAKYGVSTIFLATDDTDTARQCQALTIFNCSSLPIGRELYDVGASEAPEHNPQESAYDKWVETRIQHGEVDASEAAMHAIAEIDTLGHCDFFVGRLDSAISRMVLMLMFARQGPRPFISLDKPWAQPPFGIIN